MAIGHTLLQDRNYGTNYHWTLGKHHQLPYLKLSSRLIFLRTRLICNFYLLVPDLLLNNDVVFNLIKSSYSILLYKLWATTEKIRISTREKLR